MVGSAPRTISPITQFMAEPMCSLRWRGEGGHNRAAFLQSPLEGIPCHQLKRRCLPPINIQGWGREGGRGTLFSVGRKKEGAGLKSGTHRLSSVPKEDPHKPSDAPPPPSLFEDSSV